jgi:hypothetical protein
MTFHGNISPSSAMVKAEISQVTSEFPMVLLYFRVNLPF